MPLVLAIAAVSAPAAAATRKVRAPWSLFPYLFQLIPNVDGVPCDGIQMLGILAEIMRLHGLELKGAARASSSEEATVELELHGALSDARWQAMQLSLVSWGLMVLAARVPLEFSPNRSSILQMFD